MLFFSDAYVNLQDCLEAQNYLRLEFLFLSQYQRRQYKIISVPTFGTNKTISIIHLIITYSLNTSGILFASQ